MFHRNSLLLKKTKTYKIAYTAFASGMAGEIEDNLVPHRYARMTFNFKVKQGKLETGHGIKFLYLPTENLADEKEMDYTSNRVFEGIWHYKYFDTIQNKNIDRILLYCPTDKKIYWSYVEGDDDKYYELFSEPFAEKPVALNYRLNSKDTMLFSSPADTLKIFQASEETQQTVANGQKIVSMCVHYERIFAILEGERVSLAFSANLDPTNWNFDSDNAGFIDFVDERGTLEKVLSFNDYVYIFRQFGISRVSAYGTQSDFSVNHIFVSSSKIYGKSAVICGDKIMYLASDGVYAFDGISSVKLTLGFEKFLNKENPNCVAAYHNGNYYLACKMNFNDSYYANEDLCKNNVLIEINAKTFEVNILRSLDIVDMLAFKYKTVTKLIMAFNGGTYLAELTDNGKLFSSPTKKVWTSPKSNLGYPNRVKHIIGLNILAKKQCNIEITTDKESKTYSIPAKNTTQFIRTNIYGELVEISLISLVADADISAPELIVSLV